MRGSRRIVWYAAVILIGAALWIWSFGFGGGDYVQGLGTGLIAVGVLKLVRNIRYITDSDYREKADIAVNDERNRYISKSAWAWSGYIFVLIAAVGSIVLRIMGKSELAFAAVMAVCLLVTLYWISYVVISKRN